MENGDWRMTRGRAASLVEGRKWAESGRFGVLEAERMMMDYGGSGEWKIGDSEGCFEEGLEVC